MFCPHCGNKIKIQGQRFCSFCGADLTKPAISAQEPDSHKPLQAPTRPIQTQPPQQWTPQSSVSAPSYPQTAYYAPIKDPFSVEDSVQLEKKKSKVGVILLSVLSVLVLIGIVIAVVIGAKRMEEKEAALHADAVEAEYREGDLLYEDENIIITIGEIDYDSDYLGTGDNFFEIDLLIHSKRDDNIVIEASSVKVGDSILSTNHCYCHLAPGEDSTLRIYKREFDLEEIDSISFSLTGTGNVAVTETGHTWTSSNRFIIIPVMIEFEEPMLFD